VVSPTPLTLADAVEQWLTVKRAGRGLSPHTVRAYRADEATFAAHLHGVSPTDRSVATRVGLSELTPVKVTLALSALSALSAIQAGGAADKTRARLHGTLTGLLAYLIRQGLLEQDPLVSAGVERPKVGKRLPRYVDKPGRVRPGDPGGGHPGSGGAGSLGRAGPGVGKVVGRHRRPRRRSVCTHRGRPRAGW